MFAYLLSRDKEAREGRTRGETPTDELCPPLQGEPWGSGKRPHREDWETEEPKGAPSVDPREPAKPQKCCRPRLGGGACLADTPIPWYGNPRGMSTCIRVFSSKGTAIHAGVPQIGRKSVSICD